MKLNDILKDWFKLKVNGDVELVKANDWNDTEQYNVRSTLKAVLINTANGEVWVPISALALTHTAGQQHYIDGRYYYDFYSIEVNDEEIYSVRINANYKEER